MWSSLWPSRPDAQVRFDIRPDGQGTDLTWTLLLAEPLPDDSKLGHLRKRINQLIHANPISSIVRWPLPTQLRGSGLILFAELSCQLMTCSTVPAG